MKRQLAWTFAVVIALAACGGDRNQGDDRPVTNPTARPSPIEAGAKPEAAGEAAPAAAAAEPAPAAPAAKAQPSERLYTIQIAAYPSADSARILAEKLAARGLPVWSTEATVGGETHHRIRVGAHPSLSEIRRLGAQLSSQFEQEVWVAPVERAAAVPADAIEKTRALLSR